MEWDDLQFVLAVARGGSLSGAGRALKVNQTTVGRRLTALERRLGAPLFVRARPMFLPTEAGETVIAHAERMEREALSLAGKLDLRDFRPEGPVRIATMPWIINYLLIPALPGLAASYPSVEIQTLGSLRERSPSKREAELQLRFEMRPNSRELAVPLAEFPYAVYGPSGVPPDDLSWVSFWEDFDSFAPAKWLDRTAGKQETIRLRANDAGAVYLAIRVGLGKGLIPEVLGAGDPKLTRLSGPKPEIVRTLRALVHGDMQHVARIKVVMAWLTEVLKAPGRYTKSR